MVTRGCRVFWVCRSLPTRRPGGILAVANREGGYRDRDLLALEGLAVAQPPGAKRNSPSSDANASSSGALLCGSAVAA